TPHGQCSTGGAAAHKGVHQLSKIVIGQHAGKDVRIDLDTLLRTRMLIQANSGKGKSFLLRRLAEQLFGKVQVIILDPEGEFATLREKFGEVCRLVIYRVRQRMITFLRVDKN